MRFALLMLCAWPRSTSFFITNGLKSSSAISLGRPHWCSLSDRADDDDRTARVVDALAEQVLTEAALLTFENVGERFERTIVRARDRTAATAVVDQRVDCFLQHALFVLDDDLGRVQLEQPLEAVVAVDDAAIEIVEIGRGEAAAVELHHRAQFGRDHRNGGEDHPLRLVAAGEEGFDDFEALDRLEALLARCVSLNSLRSSS